LNEENSNIKHLTVSNKSLSYNAHCGLNYFLDGLIPFLEQFSCMWFS